jgi:signal peptidase I
MAQAARELRAPSSQPPRSETKQIAARQKSTIREWTEAIVFAVGLAMIIRTFFIQAYKIPSGSMEPTLLIGDHILVNKLIYGLRRPDSIFGLQPPGLPLGSYLFTLETVHRGDVVVFVFPPDRSKDFIKRVVAVAGDSVEVRNKAVYVNGSKQEEVHAYYEPGSENGSMQSPRDNFGPVTVPASKIFVMGDNRDRSFDSRFWGFVDRSDVEGKALVIYWSWDGDSSSLFPIRVSRFGRLVQ